MRKIAGIFIIIFAFTAPCPAFSQVPNPADLSREQDRLQQQQRQLIDEQRRQWELRDAEAGRPPGAAVTPPPEKPSAEAGRCLEIKEVEFSGNTRLSDRRIKKIIAPYLNHCLTLAAINTLLNDITNAYIEKGYITSRAFLLIPQPRLNEGALTIKIFEGQLSRVEGLKAGEKASAFPFLEGKILNLRDLEQGLDQMNRLGSNRASLDIAADESQNGYSRLIIKNEPQGRTNLGLTLDNHGSTSTGEWRAGLKASQDNLFGLNDQIDLAYTNSVFADSGQKNSRSALFGLSVPLGWWTFSNNFSYSEYKTSFPMPISGDRFYSLGDSVNDTVALERMLMRGPKYKFASTLGLTYKQNNNYMKVYDLKIKNEASSRTVSTLNLDLPLTLYFGNGMLYVKPGWAQGLRAFGAFDDRDSPYTQKAQFEAYKLYLNGNLGFKYFSFMTAIDSQWTRDELFPTDAFYLGGVYSVRGFKDESSMGDSGFLVRNDLNLKLGPVFGSQNIWLNAFTPGLFVDYGRAFPNAEGLAPASLAGAGAKLGVNYWIFDASVSWAKIIEREDWMKETSAIYVNAGINYRF